MPRYKIWMLNDVKLKNGTTLENVKVTGCVYTEIDSSYGADADGNRRGRKEFIEDAHVWDIERTMCRPTATPFTERLPRIGGLTRAFDKQIDLEVNEPIDISELDDVCHRQLCNDLEDYFKEMVDTGFTKSHPEDEDGPGPEDRDG